MNEISAKWAISGCGCPHNCYSQFPEAEMHSIQSKMAELEKPECDMHTCPHSKSNIW